VYAIAGGAQRGPIVSATIAAGSVVLLVLTTLAGLPTVEVAMGLTLVLVAALGYRTLLRWHVMLVAMLLVILFVPIKRYTLPGNLPFDMEPYRLLVMLIVGAWAASLLIDPRTKLRKSGLEGPLALIWLTSLGSVLMNGPRVDELAVGGEVVKGLMFLASFLLVVYLIVSVVRTFAHVRLLVQVLVAGGAFVAMFAVIEAQTGFNLFDRLANAIPFLTLSETIGENMTRGGRLRVFASSQGAIPLGAALVMVLPLGVYLACTSAHAARWWVAVALLALGGLSTGSRTSVIMMIVVAVVFLLTRPAQTRRAMVLLAIPALFATHLVLPGTIGSLKSSFFPEGGLIAEQSMNPGWRGSGRLADVGPTMQEVGEQPLLGQGYATRITGRGLDSNALILDNQWLKTLAETGYLGTFAWIWLFVRVGRRLGPPARADRGERGWLLAALCGSVLAFGIGMFFYDAFAFIQVTFLFYIMLALGVVALRAPPENRFAARARRRAEAPAARRPVLA
jgi:polysaccharide biosynthesis protein PslJ